MTSNKYGELNFELTEYPVVDRRRCPVFVTQDLHVTLVFPRKVHITLIACNVTQTLISPLHDMLVHAVHLLCY